MQEGVPCLWAEIPDPMLLEERRKIVMRCTGQDYAQEKTERYIGTVQDGSFVWHVYETKI